MALAVAVAVAPQKTKSHSFVQTVEAHPHEAPWRAWASLKRHVCAATTTGTDARSRGVGSLARAQRGGPSRGGPSRGGRSRGGPSRRVDQAELQQGDKQQLRCSLAEGARIETCETGNAFSAAENNFVGRRSLDRGSVERSCEPSSIAQLVTSVATCSAAGPRGKIRQEKPKSSTSRWLCVGAH
jgi:hypothetical protein